MDKRALFESHIKDYCNNDFNGESGDTLPASVILAIDKMVSSDNNRSTGISSKTKGDIVEIAYRRESMSDEVKQMLQPYRKMRW